MICILKECVKTLNANKIEGYASNVSKKSIYKQKIAQNKILKKKSI